MPTLAALLLCFAFRVPAGADSLGRVVSVIPRTAKVEVIQQGQRSPLEIGAEVFPADRIVVPTGARVALLSGLQATRLMTLPKNADSILVAAGTVLAAGPDAVLVRRGVSSALKKGTRFQKGDRIRTGKSAARVSLISEARLYDITRTVTLTNAWLLSEAFQPTTTHLDNSSLASRWLSGPIRKPRGSGRNYTGDKLIDTFRIELRDEGGVRISWKNRLDGAGRLVVSAESGERKESLYEGSFSITAQQVDLPAEKLTPRSSALLLLNFFREGRPVPEDSVDTLYFRVPTREDIDAVEDWIAQARSQTNPKMRSFDLLAVALYLSNTLMWPTRALEVVFEATKASPNAYAKDLEDSLRGMLRVRPEGYR